MGWVSSGNVGSILLVSACVLQLCSATRYQVVQGKGWNAGLRLKETEAWAASIKLVPNDTLYFEYIPSECNVLQVNPLQYQTCNSSAPIVAYASGADVVQLANPGPYYFICGLKSYCAEGVKVAVEVHVSSQDESQPAAPQKSKPSHKKSLIAGVTVAGVLGLVVAAGIMFFCLGCKCVRHDTEPKSLTSDTQSSGTYGRSSGSSRPSKGSSAASSHPRPVLDTLHVRPYTLAQVKEITVNFETKIGRGGFGPVFYGKLNDGQEVAVKVCSKDSQQGEGEFINEVRLLSRVHHKNIVPLLGYCQEDDQQILMYEFMHGGDLQNRLQGPSAISNPLAWRERLGIALDAARGMEYLHTGLEQPIIHRDIKSSNILLTRNRAAKVADFGLSKLVASEHFSPITTHVKGTAGYLDPDYFLTTQLTERSDVYSFGVLLLELISGRPPIFQVTPGTNIGIVQWVKQGLQNGNVEEIVDPLLQGDFDVESVWKLAETALQCVDIERNSRPSMSAVVRELKQAFNIELGMATSDRSTAISSFLSRAALNGPPNWSSGKPTAFGIPFGSPDEAMSSESQALSQPSAR